MRLGELHYDELDHGLRETFLNHGAVQRGPTKQRVDDCPLGFTEKNIIPMRVKAGEGLFCTISIETFFNHSGVVTPSLVRLSHFFCSSSYKSGKFFKGKRHLTSSLGPHPIATKPIDT